MQMTQGKHKQIVHIGSRLNCFEPFSIMVEESVVTEKNTDTLQVSNTYLTRL